MCRGSSIFIAHQFEFGTIWMMMRFTKIAIQMLLCVNWPISNGIYYCPVYCLCLDSFDVHFCNVANRDSVIYASKSFITIPIQNGRDYVFFRNQRFCVPIRMCLAT